MKHRLLIALQAIFLVIGLSTIQACFVSEPAPVAVGDYDDAHAWHDRHWWIANHHDWVHEHHPDWVSDESHEEHDMYEHHH